MAYVKDRSDTRQARIYVETHQKLLEISMDTGEKQPTILKRAVDLLWEETFWKRAEQGFIELRADSKAWSVYRAEGKAWDETLSDGLIQ